MNDTGGRNKMQSYQEMSREELLKEKEIPEMMISDFAGKQNGPYGPAGVAFYGILRSNL